MTREVAYNTTDPLKKEISCDGFSFFPSFLPHWRPRFL